MYRINGRKKKRHSLKLKQRKAVVLLTDKGLSDKCISYA